MKILLIDYDAGTERLGGDTQSWDLAVEWKKHGVETRIVAASFSHLRDKNPENATGEFVQQEGVGFLWIKAPAAAEREKKIIRGMLPFDRGIRRAAPLIAGWGPDVVLLSSRHLLGTAAAISLSQKLQIPLVFLVNRVYPAHLEEVLEYAPGHYLIRMFARTQKKAYRKSRLVTAVYPALGEHMEQMGADPSKFVPIPQGLSPLWFRPHRPPQRHLDFIHRYQEKGNFILLAAGMIEKDQGLDLLLDSAALLSRDALVLVVGNGLHKPNLKREAKQRGLSNLLFLDGVQPAQIPDLYRAADCVYVGLPDYQWHRFGADVTRILLGMESGTPVLCAADIPYNPVEEAGCGQIVSPSDPKALASALERIQKLSETKRMEMGCRGQAYVEQNARISHQAGSLLDVLRQAKEE